MGAGRVLRAAVLVLAVTACASGQKAGESPPAFTFLPETTVRAGPPQTATSASMDSPAPLGTSAVLSDGWQIVVNDA